MRSWRSELLTMSMVLAVPTWIVSIFPYEAIGFGGEERACRHSGTAAFVFLSADEEAAALKAAKTSLQGRRMHSRVNLAVGSLPDDGVAMEVLPLEYRRHESADLLTELTMPPFLPSQAAARPKRIPACAPIAVEPTFSREDLLKID